jgi:thiamine biosynthesis lipoprotein
VLRARGVGNALLEISGDLIALGAPPGGDGWTVDIVDSEEPARRRVAVTLRDCALATSSVRGTTVRFGGVERGHLMNPRNAGGRPAVRQATVVAPGGLLADALSTAAVVSGQAPAEATGTWLLA